MKRAKKRAKTLADGLLVLRIVHTWIGGGMAMARRRKPTGAGARKRPDKAETSWEFGLSAWLVRRRSARLAPPDPSMPERRRLRVYAQDPALSYDDGAVYTVSIPYEPLKPGPEGALLVIEPLPEPQSPLTAAKQKTAGSKTPVLAAPVDLDAPALLMEHGLAPSTTSRPFMQQMLYAVCMETYECFARALGRDPGFGPLGGEGARDGRLRVRGMSFKEANAFYDREEGVLHFGYDLAGSHARGRGQQGAEVYIALSRDVVAHEMSHAMLDSLRPNFLRPTHKDIGGLHEGFSDLVALLMRFAQQDVVERAIAATQGSLQDHRLMEIGRQFGFDLIDGQHALRSAAAADPNDNTLPDERRYAHNTEEHDLGAVLLSAMFDAFCAGFERATGTVRRVLIANHGRLPHEGVVWLAKEAVKIAKRFLNIAIRAIDYCPPLHCTFGEYLRALLTADRDVSGEDGVPYREIVITSFRRFGITVPDVPNLSEDSLLWKPPQSGRIVIPELRFRELGLDFRNGRCDWPDDDDGATLRRAAQALGKTICTPRYAHDFGLAAPNKSIRKPVILSLRTLRRVSPREEVTFDLVAEVLQQRRVPEGWFFGGATIVISSEGEVRYAIAKHVDSTRRLQAQRLWLKGQDKEVRDAAWDTESLMSVGLIAERHRQRKKEAG
jgi:hypothetical protein